jgi:peroxiredoxin family protein
MPHDFEIKTIYRVIDKSTRIIGKIQNSVIKFTSKAAMGMRKLDRANARVRNTVTRGLKIGFATASAAAVGLYAAINKTADSMDKLAKKTRAIDFPIEEYQEWSYVAEQSGLDLKKYDKGLNTFVKRIGKLRGGFGPLAAALKKTNPGLAKTLKSTTDTSDAMDIMVKAIQQAKTSADKSMLADAAYGVTNFSLIAGNTTEQLSKLRAEMRENGVVTERQASLAESYNDMMNRVKKTLGGLIVNVLTPLMPIVTELANKFREWAVANKSVISETFKKALQWIRDNFEQIQYWAEKIGKAIVAFYGLSGAISGASKAMQALSAVSKMNKFVLLAIAIAAVVAAIWVFKDEIAELGSRLVGWFEYIKEKIIDVANHPKEYMIAAWQETKEAILSIVSSLWSGIVTVATTWLNTLISLVKFQFSNFADIFSAVGNLLVGNWDAAAAKIFGILDRIKSAAKVILDPIISVMRSVGDYLGFYNPVKEAEYVQKQQSNIEKYASTGPGMSDEWSMSSGGTQVARPSVSVARSESVQREDVNVRITDETRGGRARMEGKSNRVQLAHTGVMP